MKARFISKTILAGAAIAGVFAGSALKASGVTTGKDTNAKAGVLADKKDKETHDCKGKNSCKGKGGCKAGDNGCAGKNSCKSKGGCAMKNGKPVHKE